MTIFGDLYFNLKVPSPYNATLSYNHTQTSSDLVVNYTFAVILFMATIIGELIALKSSSLQVNQFKIELID